MKHLDAGQLIEDFQDPQYRKSYAEGFLHSWIAHQLTVVRKQRGLTQKELGERVGTPQPGIARMERDGYGRWNLKKLVEVAFALDCRLHVSLETFGSLIRDAVAFSPERLQRPSFAEDEVFFPRMEAAAIGPVRELRSSLISWLQDDGPLEQLAEWLRGYGLPHAGDELTPAEWLSDALPPDQPEMRKTLARRVAEAFLDRWDTADRWIAAPASARPRELVKNLFELAARLRSPETLGDPLWCVYLRSARACLLDSESPAPRHPFAEAILFNQPDERFSRLWLEHFLRGRDSELMLDYVPYGLVGMSYMGIAPSAVGIARGAAAAIAWPIPKDETIHILVRAFQRVWSEFSGDASLPRKVFNAAAAQPTMWHELVLKAFCESVVNHTNPEDAHWIASAERVVGCVS
jgi:transcriptional regulator with XRE-family HTH domain